MKKMQIWLWCLAPVLALFVGCKSDHYASGNPGPGVTYEQGNYPQQPYQYNDQYDNTTTTGAPYESQHPMPRDQMPQ